jgi:signal transduction histidine kinase
MASGKRILLEIQDQCGGLPPGKVGELFHPFSQKTSDKSGLGLGLTIVRRAVSLNDGTISVHNLPNEGCVFTIDMPLALQKQ